MFVTCNEPSKVLEPTDRSLHFPAATVSSQFATVLNARLDSIGAMWGHQIDSTSFKPFSQRIAIRSHVVDKTAWLPSNHALFKHTFNECYFVRTGTGRING